MKLEDQVTNHYLSARMRESGFPAGSMDFCFYWMLPKPGTMGYKGMGWVLGRLEEFGTVHLYDFLPAYTVAELGEMLPKSIDDKWFLRIKPVKNSVDKWEVHYVGRKNKEMTFRYLEMEPAIQGDSEANARAKMLIHLKENKLI